MASPWLIPGLAAAAPVGWFGSDMASGVGVGLMADPGQRVTFGRCQTGLERTCVVDGDTIWLDGVKVRMLDIDAPETRDYKCVSEKALGDRATTPRRSPELRHGVAGAFRTGRGPLRPQAARCAGGRPLRWSVLVTEGLARPWSGKRRPWCP